MATIEISGTNEELQRISTFLKNNHIAHILTTDDSQELEDDCGLSDKEITKLFTDQL